MPNILRRCKWISYYMRRYVSKAEGEHWVHVPSKPTFMSLTSGALPLPPTPVLKWLYMRPQGLYVSGHGGTEPELVTIASAGKTGLSTFSWSAERRIQQLLLDAAPGTNARAIWTARHSAPVSTHAQLLRARKWLRPPPVLPSHCWPSLLLVNHRKHLIAPSQPHQAPM